MTQHQEFANILVDSSAKMLTCAKQIERGLQSVLDLADRCSPEIALLTADSITALSQNVAGAPLIFAKKLRPTGVKMRHMVEILSHVLSHVKPQRVRSKEDMMRALRSTSSICEKFSVGQDVATLYRLLVYEIARVFFELRTALKKQAGGAARRLYKSVDSYFCRIREPLVCFSYNSLKLRVCMRELRKCGAARSVSKDVIRSVVKNTRRLSTRTRAMAIFLPYFRDTVDIAKALAKH